MSWKRNRLECTSQKSAKRRVLRNARLGEFCDFFLPTMSSEKVPASIPRFISSSYVYPSVGKCFHKQSAEHATPLDQPVVQYGTSLVGFIYFAKYMFLTTLLRTDETPKAAALLSEYSQTKCGATHIPYPKQLLTNLLGTLNLYSSISKRWTQCTCYFLQALIDFTRMLTEELSSVQDSDLAW